MLSLPYPTSVGATTRSACKTSTPTVRQGCTTTSSGITSQRLGGENLYWFAPSASNWIDPLGWIYWKKGTPKSANWRLPKDGTWTGSSIGHALSDIPDNAKIKFEIV